MYLLRMYASLERNSLQSKERRTVRFQEAMEADNGFASENDSDSTVAMNDKSTTSFVLNTASTSSFIASDKQPSESPVVADSTLSSTSTQDAASPGALSSANNCEMLADGNAQSSQLEAMALQPAGSAPTTSAVSSAVSSSSASAQVVSGPKVASGVLTLPAPAPPVSHSIKSAVSIAEPYDSHPNVAITNEKGRCVSKSMYCTVLLHTIL